MNPSQNPNQWSTKPKQRSTKSSRRLAAFAQEAAAKSAAKAAAKCTAKGAAKSAAATRLGRKFGLACDIASRVWVGLGLGCGWGWVWVWVWGGLGGLGFRQKGALLSNGCSHVKPCVWRLRQVQSHAAAARYCTCRSWRTKNARMRHCRCSR